MSIQNDTFKVCIRQTLYHNKYVYRVLLLSIQILHTYLENIGYLFLLMVNIIGNTTIFSYKVLRHHCVDTIVSFS
ncbi:hypothetical protein B566_EDAN017508 [Ephemera danica]|nr:hypothetical protein B566_EDAN017508 [Ephemera danica]